jgi:hypothetical protein
LACRKTAKLPLDPVLLKAFFIMKFFCLAFLFCVLLGGATLSQNIARRDLLPVGHLIAGHDMTSARGGHSATVLPDFRIFLAGGKDQHGNILDTTEIYDSSTETFTRAAKMIVPREGHAAGVLSDGKILIAGGVTRGGTALASSEDYDFETGEFTRRGTMHAARIRPGVTVLRDGRILVTGGTNGKTVLSSAETYEVLNGKWTLAGKMTTARLGHTATLLADGRVLITGGMSSQHKALSSAEIFDPQTNKFSAVSSLHEARYFHAAGLLPTGDVFVVGGVSDAAQKAMIKSAEMYAPATHSFSSVGKMNEARMKLPDLAASLDGRLLILGGAAPGEIYDPKTGSFREVEGSMDGARFYSAAIQLMDGSMRIFGGYDSTGTSTAKTWIYRP